MKLLLLLLLALLPSLAMAQSIPTMDRRVTLQGPSGLNWAMSTKADANGGSLVNPTVVGGKLTDPAISGGTSTEQSIANPSISGGTSSGTTINGASIDSASTVYGPTQANLTSKLLATGIRLTPQMYGAVADGVTDDTVSFQKAVTAICSFSKQGGELWVPPGAYRVSSVTIPCQGVYIVGSGVGNRDASNGTVINALAGASPVFWFHAGSENYTYGGGVRDLALKNDGMTIQPMIEADYTQQFAVDHVYSFGAFRLIKINGGRSPHVSHLKGEAILPGGTGIELAGSGTTATGSSATRLDTPMLSDVSLEAGAASGSTGTTHMTGIYIDGFVATPQLLHVEILNAHYGVRIDCGGINQTATELDACVQFADFRDVEIDFADLYGIYAEDFQFLKFIGGYVHGSRTMANGIKLANNKFMSYGAEILGGKVDSAQGSLVYSTVQGTHVTDMDLASANKGGVGGSGVEIMSDTAGSTVAHSVISNNTMCYYHGSAPTTMTGVNIGSTITNVAITGNVFTGCDKGVAYSGGAATVQARSLAVAAQRCLNLYPEPLPQQEQEPIQFAHYPTPGSAVFTTPEVGVVRCLYQSSQGDLIAAVGSGVYVVHANKNSTKIGTITSGSGQVRMQDNGTTLFIVDGTAKGGWYCSLPQKPQQGLYGALTQIVDSAFYGSRTIAILDTFFLYTNPDTTNWYVGPAQFSDEATTPFDSLYVASKTSYPDTIAGVAVVGQTIWLFGTQETELWYTSGAADFPFQRLPSLSIGSGCVAPYSISANSDVVFWLGKDKSGLPRVYMGAGQAAQPVSTYAIENAIQAYADCADAIGNIYQQNGHAFYVLTFPATGKTWAYDLSTSLWHERCGSLPDGQTEAPLRANAWANAYGKVFCGDPKNGTIYEVSLDLDTHAGLPIKRQRAFPHAIGDGQRMIHRKMMLDMQNGSGATVNVDWSDDRGQTFCAPIPLTLGASGNVWPTLWRLGLARDRVYRLTWTGGDGAALIGAFLDADTVAS